jgi:RNA polymerase sigma-70 factor, ECF subfamily
VHDVDWLAERFESQRIRLRAVAYRMLGSLAEADDAVQETWLRLSRSDADEIDNLNGWLTTVVARVSLNTLQSRKARREEQTGTRVPDPIVTLADQVDPEQQAILADSVGLALLVVLESLAPAERLAFVLHDMFGVSFAEIAPIVDRSPAAARQLASRARRRVRTSAVPDRDLARQQRVADAFFAAVRDGDFEGLLAVLDPDVVLRADGGALGPGAVREVRGARAVAAGAVRFARFAPFARSVLVNGAVGFVGRYPDGRLLSVAGLTIKGDKIVEIDILTDQERLEKLDLPTLSDEHA